MSKEKVLGVLTSSAFVALVIAYFPAHLKVKGVCRDRDGHVEYNVVVDGRGLRSANNVRVAFDFWDTASGRLDRTLQFDPTTAYTLAEEQNNEHFQIRLTDPVTFFQHLTIHVADVNPKPGSAPDHPKVVVSAEHVREKLVEWNCTE